MANNSSNAEDVGSCLELNQIEPVFSLAFEQMRSEIQNTCSTLAISPGKYNNVYLIKGLCKF